MISKELMDGDFGKCVQREDLDKSSQICINAELFAGDGHRQIDTDRSPQLEADRGVGGAIKGLNTQAVFEPPKEQLDFPTLPIGVGDHRRRSGPKIGPKRQPAVMLGVVDGACPVFPDIGKASGN